MLCAPKSVRIGMSVNDTVFYRGKVTVGLRVEGSMLSWCRIAITS